MFKNRTKVEPHRDSIALGQAKLCIDCECIYEGWLCPRCMSDHFWFLTKFIPLKGGDVEYGESTGKSTADS